MSTRMLTLGLIIDNKMITAMWSECLDQPTQCTSSLDISQHGGARGPRADPERIQENRKAQSRERMSLGRGHRGHWSCRAHGDWTDQWGPPSFEQCWEKT